MFIGNLSHMGIPEDLTSYDSQVSTYRQYRDIYCLYLQIYGELNLQHLLYITKSNHGLTSLTLH